MKFVTTTLFAVVLGAPSQSAEALHQSGEIKHLLAKHGDVKNSSQFGEFYQRLFAICDASELVALNNNVNDSIATQSAWERVNLTVPKEQGPKVYRPDAGKLSWFLGFFEGRNRVAAPDWWREVVLGTRAHRRDIIYPGKPEKQPYHRTTVEGVACPANATVAEENRVVTYHVGDDSIVVPEELLDRDDAGDLWCNISCAFRKAHCFVAIHGDVGYPHTVACIDRQTGEIVWKSKACGCWWGGATGIPESWVTVVPTDDGRVFVFGSASIGFYAHGFAASNGKTIVQFSSNY